MKFRNLIVAAAVLLVCAAVAQAQVQLFTTPVSRVIKNDRTALLGDVILRAVAPGVGTPGDTVEVTFVGMTITNNVITGISAAGSSWTGGVNVIGVDGTNGVITLEILGTTVAAGEEILLEGVRTNVENHQGEVEAAISSTQIQVQPPNRGVVLVSTQAGLDLTPDVDNVAQIIATAPSGAVPATPPVVTLTEGFINAWRGPNEMGLGHTPDPNASAGTNIGVTFSGIPEGVSLSVTLQGALLGTLWESSASTVAAFDSDNLGDVIEMPDGSDEAGIDEIELSIAITAPTPDLPYPAGNVTVVFDFDPQAPAVLGFFPGTNSSDIPSFAPCPTEPVTVLSIVPAETNLLFTHAQFLDGVTDTGMAIANTTEDPLGSSGAVPQTALTVTVTAFAQDGSSVTFTPTDDSVGNGLNSDGSLGAGASWVFQLSELLDAAGVSADFTGYVWVQVAATHADGLAILFTTNGQIAHGYQAQAVTVGSNPSLSRLPFDESLGH